MELNEQTKPKVYTLDDMKPGKDHLVPGAYITNIPGSHIDETEDVEGPGAVGLYFMEPGAQTTVFSLEENDDGTAEEYYGPCYEFYYILIGEFTIYWGKDAAEIRNGTANKLHLKAGEMGYYPVGWKFSAKNTGKVPGTFFWGLSKQPEGIKRRVIKEAPDWLKKSKF